MDAQQPKTEPIVGVKRHYNEEEGQQPDIYDAYPNKKPRLMDAIDTNLTVTFSDTDSSDEKGMAPLEHYREKGTLPYLGWWAPLERARQQKMFKVKDFWKNAPSLTMEAYQTASLNIIAPAIYQLEYEDTEETHIITIPRDASMTDIKDHPSFWFLKQVLEFRWTNPYPSPRDPLYDEKRGEYALVAAKILDYANHRGHTISPSWTLAKDVPDQVILAMIDMIDTSPSIMQPGSFIWPSFISSTWRTSNQCTRRSISRICVRPNSSSSATATRTSTLTASTATTERSP